MNGDRERRAALLRVAVGLDGPVRPDRATWEEWMWLARIERLVPLLYRLVDVVPTDLDDHQRAEVRRTQGAVLSRCVQLEHHLVRVTGLFADAGIRAAALKGGATAHLDYPDPSWREVGDIDLLIDPSDRDAAVEILATEGWTHDDALPRGHERFSHDVTFVRDRMELDLHQRVSPRAVGLLVPTEELLEQAVPFVIAGREVLALGPVDRLIHSALHAVTSRGAYRRLSSVADVLLAATLRADDAPAVMERAERWRVRSLVERALVDGFRAADHDIPKGWRQAMGVAPRRRDRLVDRAYLGPTRRPILEELAYLRRLGTVHDRWDYVRGHLAPGSAYAATHDRRGVAAQARYVWARLRSRSS